MDIIFKTQVGKLVGTDAALIFSEIAKWVHKNKANDSNFNDGKYWAFNTKKGWIPYFEGYYTERQIKYFLDKLKKAGLIERGEYNKLPTDRTSWYTLTALGWSLSGYEYEADTQCPPQQTQCDRSSGQPVSALTSIEHTNILTYQKKEKNNARAREAIIADIKTENQLWIDNMMMHHKVESENEVLELAAWGYDQVALKGNEPTRGDIMKYCNAHVSDWREHKRREAIKAIPINDRRLALWEEVCKYREEYSYTIRFNWTERMVKPSKSDPDIMIFEEQPGLNVPVELNKYKLRYEQRNQHTAL